MQFLTIFLCDIVHFMITEDSAFEEVLQIKNKNAQQSYSEQYLTRVL